MVRVLLSPFRKRAYSSLEPSQLLTIANLFPGFVAVSTKTFVPILPAVHFLEGTPIEEGARNEKWPFPPPGAEPGRFEGLHQGGAYLELSPKVAWKSR